MRLQALPAIRSASPRIKPFPPSSVSYLFDGLLSSSAGVQTQRRKEAACLRSHCVRRVRGFLRFGAVSDRVAADFAYVKKYYLEDATGTYINRNHFAGLLEMVLPFTVALGLHLAGKLRRAAQRSEAMARSLLSAPELLPLVCLLFLAVVIFTALIFSRSRMGILSALASLMAVLALAGSSSLSKRTRAVVAALFSSVSSELLLGWEAIPWSCALRFLDRNTPKPARIAYRSGATPLG